MKSGRDIRRGNRPHQANIVTDAVRTERLSDVGINVDSHGQVGRIGRVGPPYLP
jgi:hypothetical protein